MYKFPIKKVLTPFAALLIVAACSDQPDPALKKTRWRISPVSI